MSGSKLLDDSSSAPPSESVHSPHPIGLTVYDLPPPDQEMVDAAQRTSKGRWKMLLVMLICAAPVVASYFTYYVIRPQGLRNFGQLIEPQQAMPALTAHTLDGQPFALQELKGQWLLISVGPGQCEAACQQQLYFQRQLRESLGKDKDRVDRVWLITDDQALPPAMEDGMQQAVRLRIAANEVAAWLKPQAGHALTAHLYLVDPLGNWMLRFPPNMDLNAASKAKRDLDRVLRASSSWDQAGR